MWKPSRRLKNTTSGTTHRQAEPSELSVARSCSCFKLHFEVRRKTFHLQKVNVIGKNPRCITQAMVTSRPAGNTEREHRDGESTKAELLSKQQGPWHRKPCKGPLYQNVYHYSHFQMDRNRGKAEASKKMGMWDHCAPLRLSYRPECRIIILLLKYLTTKLTFCIFTLVLNIYRSLLLTSWGFGVLFCFFQRKASMQL